MDALGLTECVRRDDESTGPGIRAILRNGNVMDIAVTLAKLLAEACDDMEIDPVWFRFWARSSAGRP
jgi:hypothetical protein